jgi:hypothetical protein
VFRAHEGNAYVERTIFAARLVDAARHAVEFARGFVEERLPDAVRFRVELNSSYDGNPLPPDVRTYPDDRRKHPLEQIARLSIESLVDLLWRDGAVPEWIDFSVEAVDEDATIIGVMTCGRFTTSESRLYHEREGRPPFHVLGPALPPEKWRDNNGRFSLWWSTAAHDAATFELALAHADKVRILSLEGAWADDAVVASARAFTRLVTLRSEGTAIIGDGLAHLHDQPIGHVTLSRVSLPTLRLAGLAELRQVSSIHIAGLAPVLHGLGSLAGHRTLESVTVHIPSLDDCSFTGQLPALRHLDLAGTRVRSLATLSDAMTLRSLSLAGTLVTDRELAHVGGLALRTLSLDDTTVGDAGVKEVCRNARLRRLWLAGTAVTDISLAALAALPDLEHLDVQRTRVTAAAVAKLSSRSKLYIAADRPETPAGDEQ